jgi:hypothetical protein
MLWDPAFHRALGRRGVDVSFLGRPALLCPVTSPATAPHVRGLTGAVAASLLVSLLLSALAALRCQSMSATFWQDTVRLQDKTPPRVPSLLLSTPDTQSLPSYAQKTPGVKPASPRSRSPEEPSQNSHVRSGEDVTATHLRLSPFVSLSCYPSGDPRIHPSSYLCLGSTRRSSSLELCPSGRENCRHPREQPRARLRVNGARTRPPRSPPPLPDLAAVSTPSRGEHRCPRRAVAAVPCPCRSPPAKPSTESRLPVRGNRADPPYLPCSASFAPKPSHGELLRSHHLRRSQLAREASCMSK